MYTVVFQLDRLIYYALFSSHQAVSTNRVMLLMSSLNECAVNYAYVVGLCLHFVQMIKQSDAEVAFFSALTVVLTSLLWCFCYSEFQNIFDVDYFTDTLETMSAY